MEKSNLIGLDVSGPPIKYKMPKQPPKPQPKPKKKPTKK